MSDYEAEARRVDEKTARLRALRLAREAKDTAEATPARRKQTKRRKSPGRQDARSS